MWSFSDFKITENFSEVQSLAEQNAKSPEAAEELEEPMLIFQDLVDDKKSVSEF